MNAGTEMPPVSNLALVIYGDPEGYSGYRRQPKSASLLRLGLDKEHGSLLNYVWADEKV